MQYTYTKIYKTTLPRKNIKNYLIKLMQKLFLTLKTSEMQYTSQYTNTESFTLWKWTIS